MEEEREKAEEVKTGEEMPEQEKETLNREIKSRDAEIVRLRQALAVKDSEIAALKQSLEEAKRQLDEIAMPCPGRWPPTRRSWSSQTRGCWRN